MVNLEELHPGMRVRVTTDPKDTANGVSWNDTEMIRWEGKIMTVRVVESSYCQMEEDVEECQWQHGWMWAPQWLELAEDDADADIVADDFAIASLFA